MSEIYYLISIANIILSFSKNTLHSYKDSDVKRIAISLNLLNFCIDDVINYSVYLKRKFNCKIDNNAFLTFIDFMQFINYFYDRIDDEIIKDSNKFY